MLVALAESLGLPGAVLSSALASREVQPSVLQDESLAQTLGLIGVPAFVAGRSAALSGLKNLQALVARARERTPPPRL